MFNADGLDKKLLLSFQSACNEKGVALPWEKIAEHLDVGATGGAIIQHLSKMRQKMSRAGEPIPPALKRGGHMGHATSNSTGHPGKVSKTFRLYKHSRNTRTSPRDEDDQDEDLEKDPDTDYQPAKVGGPRRIVTSKTLKKEESDEEEDEEHEEDEEDEELKMEDGDDEMSDPEGSDEESDSYAKKVGTYSKFLQLDGDETPERPTTGKKTVPKSTPSRWFVFKNIKNHGLPDVGDDFDGVAPNVGDFNHSAGSSGPLINQPMGNVTFGAGNGYAYGGLSYQVPGCQYGYTPQYADTTMGYDPTLANAAGYGSFPGNFDGMTATYCQQEPSGPLYGSSFGGFRDGYLPTFSTGYNSKLP